MSRKKHGLRKHPLYGVWDGIKQRCYNPNSGEYHNYGLKGIQVCDEWRYDFKAFYDWCIVNGWKKGLEVDKDFIPKKLQIPALLYSPQFCSILTKSENNRLKKSTKLNSEIVILIKSSLKSQRQLAKEYNVAKGTIQKIKENKMWI